DVESLTVDGGSALEAARMHASMLSDELPAKIRPHSDSYPLFEAHRIDAQTEKALGRKVWLKSGGYLVFDYAEALTVIDVNTGRYVGKKSLSDTVFEINC